MSQMSQLPNQSRNDEAPLPVRPRGQALKRTAAQLDEMTSSDALRESLGEADADWKENAPKPYSLILEAEAK